MSKDVSMFNTKYRQIHRQLTGIGTKVKSALEARTSQQYFWWFVGIVYRGLFHINHLSRGFWLFNALTHNQIHAYSGRGAS